MKFLVKVGVQSLSTQLANFFYNNVGHTAIQHTFKLLCTVREHFNDDVVLDNSGTLLRQIPTTEVCLKTSRGLRVDASSSPVKFRIKRVFEYDKNKFCQCSPPYS